MSDPLQPPSAPSVKECQAVTPDDVYLCEKLNGHAGPHECFVGKPMSRTWTDSASEVQPPAAAPREGDKRICPECADAHPQTFYKGQWTHSDNVPEPLQPPAAAPPIDLRRLSYAEDAIQQALEDGPRPQTKQRLQQARKNIRWTISRVVDAPLPIGTDGLDGLITKWQHNADFQEVAEGVAYDSVEFVQRQTITQTLRICANELEAELARLRVLQGTEK